MGVRYNAEKKKIGAYYSTPIFSFRCKCHLCDGWFEIQTDPKVSHSGVRWLVSLNRILPYHQNTRYVVTSGARQKDEDWNPEENGGFAVHGRSSYQRLGISLTSQPETDKESATVDPLVALEKTTDAKNYMENVQRPRIEYLQDASEHYNADPYSLSLKARKRFREEKKVEQKKRKSDDLLKGRYGLPETLKLLEDDEKAIEEAKIEWEEAKREQMRASKRKKTTLAITSIPSTSRLSSSSTNYASSSLNSLRTRILQNTARKSGALQTNLARQK